MTRNRRIKIKARMQQTVTRASYVEARRHAAAPAPAAAEKVTVQPSRADWQRAKQCSLWGKLQGEHGPLIALRISQGPRWWELDDLARAAAGALQNRPPELRGLWLSVWPRYAVTRREYLPGIAANLDRVGALERLEVREVPDAAVCSHASCRRRRGLAALPPADRAAARRPVSEPLPLRDRSSPSPRSSRSIRHSTATASDYYGLSREERIQQIERHRQDLISRADTVRQVHDWLVVNIAPIKTPNTGSYELKHLAEDLLGEYVTNGELITAALMAGYPMRRDHGPNADFAMSSRDVTRLRKQQEQARLSR